MAKLDGVCVMVVEDELLVGVMIEQILRGAGCRIAGPYRTVETAVAAARDLPIDVAVLDVMMAGERIDPVVDVLTERQVPQLFLTGYGGRLLTHPHNRRSVLPKPFRPADLIARIARAVQIRAHHD